MLSTFYIFYEFDNYKRQLSSCEFRYKEGLYKNFETKKELYLNQKDLYSIIVNRFEQLMYINLIIFALIIGLIVIEWKLTTPH